MSYYTLRTGLEADHVRPLTVYIFSCRIPRCQREVLRAQTERRKGGMKE